MCVDSSFAYCFCLVQSDPIKQRLYQSKFIKLVFPLWQTVFKLRGLCETEDQLDTSYISIRATFSTENFTFTGLTGPQSSNTYRVTI